MTEAINAMDEEGLGWFFTQDDEDYPCNLWWRRSQLAKETTRCISSFTNFTEIKNVFVNIIDTYDKNILFEIVR